MKKNRKGSYAGIIITFRSGKTTICKEILKKLKSLNCQFLILPGQKEKAKLMGGIIFLFPKKI